MSGRRFSALPRPMRCYSAAVRHWSAVGAAHPGRRNIAFSGACRTSAGCISSGTSCAGAQPLFLRSLFFLLLRVTLIFCAGSILSHKCLPVKRNLQNPCGFSVDFHAVAWYTMKKSGRPAVQSVFRKQKPGCRIDPVCHICAS